MTTVSQILERLEKEADGLDVAKLEKALKLSKKIDRVKLGIAVQALTKLGIIINIGNERLEINNDSNFIKGRVRCSSKGYCFVVREDQGEDIYIRESKLNHAWHGDSVIVIITKEGHKRRAPEGSIQCVLKRYNNILLAKVDSDKSNNLLKAYPLDDRIPEVIEIDNYQDNLQVIQNKDQIYEIEINQYPIGQINAKGSIIRALPLNAGVEGDIEILLSKNNISKIDVNPKVTPKKIPSNGREDLTYQPALLFRSWECSNSPSLPALYAEPYEGGNRIWIHSPSVSERINIGGKLDKYLQDKGEVTCLGNNWLEFLNEGLNSASEFKIDQENQSISLMIDINKDGEIVDWKFSLTNIKPIHLITSKHLVAINRRRSTSKTVPISLKPIKNSLEVIYTIIHSSKLIYQNINGSIKLDLDIPNLKRLNELHKVYPSRDFNGWSKTLDINDPQSILDIYIRFSSNILAKHLITYKLPFIYKEYEEIDSSAINELTKSALSLDENITLNIDGTVTTNELIKSFETSPQKKIFHKLVKHMIPGINLKLFKLSPDNQEQNLISQLSNNNIESPWCCPSLNYWNIFNQFIISSLLNYGKNKSSSRSKEIIELGSKDSFKDIKWEIFTSKIKDNIDNYSSLNLIQFLNDKRRNSKLFRNNIISIAQCREAQKIIGHEVSATITGVQSYGFFAEIDDLTAEGLVHVSTLGDDWYEYRSRQNLLVGRKNKKTYQLAQRVNVRVLKVDILKNQIDLELVKIDEPVEITSNDISSEIKNKKL